jgi:hypothetical protein
MPQTIEPLINLAETDLDLQKYIFAKSHLEQQIDTARSVVDEYQKKVDKRKDELRLLSSECSDVKNNLQILEELISRLDSQVPRIRNEKEFAASKNQLEEARKNFGLLEEKMLDLDLKKEDLENDIKTIKNQLNESNTEFKQETSGLLKKQAGAEKKIETLEPRLKRLLQKVPEKIRRFYERCQESGISTPICAIKDKSCSGCNMVLLPQLVNELMANTNSHKNCPNCSRILFFPEVEEEKSTP